MSNNTKLNILHLASYFSGVSKVYENLIGEMDKLGHTQYVYVPHRRLKKEKIVNFFNPQSEIFLRPIYNRFSSFAYFYKIKTAYSDLIKQDSICKISIVHAHTWFSDGGIAYRLFKEKGVPYVITIRSTDISVFAKYCLHTHSYARDILLNAKNIIFLSKAYKDKVFNLGFIKKYVPLIADRSVIIPNGIDGFWIRNLGCKTKKLGERIRLIYIGSFIRRKNLFRLIEACDNLVKSGRNIELNLIGGGPGRNKSLEAVIKKKEFVNFIGKVADKKELAQMIRKNDIFVMPSYGETFGLVYIEALSQGIPLLYSKNDGIDGLYPFAPIGEAADPFSVADITIKLTNLIDNYELYSFEPKTIAENHHWGTIVNRLVATYID